MDTLDANGSMDDKAFEIRYGWQCLKCEAGCCPYTIPHTIQEMNAKARAHRNVMKHPTITFSTALHIYFEQP